MDVLGVDGCSEGWVAVRLRDGRFQDAVVFRAFRELIDEHRGARAIAVDIPMSARA